MSNQVTVDADKLNAFINLVHDAACYSQDSISQILPNPNICHQVIEKTQETMGKYMTEILEECSDIRSDVREKIDTL